MSDQPAAATEVRLALADAAELADLLEFLRDWLTSSQDSETLAASLDRFPGSAGTDTSPALQLALNRFASLLTPTAGEVDF
ncbi:MAG: hypothetical protein ACRDQ7_08175 [Haloechinothrix sp.]